MFDKSHGLLLLTRADTYVKVLEGDLTADYHARLQSDARGVRARGSARNLCGRDKTDDDDTLPTVGDPSEDRDWLHVLG